MIIGVSCLLLSVQIVAQKNIKREKSGTNDDHEIEIVFGFVGHDKAEDESPLLRPTSFVGKSSEHFIQLEWTINAIGPFIIEHSDDDQFYKAIDTITMSLGFSANDFRYQVSEYNAGKNYFRLKRISPNGVIQTSESIKVIEGQSNVHVLDIETVATNKKVTLQVKKAQQVYMTLYDGEGKVTSNLFEGELMDNEIIFRSLNKGDYPQATYFIVVEGENFRESKRIRF